MKLLCITKGPMYDAAVAGHWAIEFGETYEAIKEVQLPRFGKYYVLAEDPMYGYAEEHFVPMPDDKEVEEYLQEQEAARLDREFAKIVHEFENA